MFKSFKSVRELSDDELLMFLLIFADDKESRSVLGRALLSRLELSTSMSQ